MSELAEMQLRMHAAMTDPHGVPAGAATLVHGSPHLSAEQRLELYRRTYHQRLGGCLRDSYPALRHALGDELFDDFAREYLEAHPPRGTSLATLGTAFPDYLQATRPDRDLPSDEREPWADFLVDLARAERTFWEVYDGPGVEGVALPGTVRELTARGASTGPAARPTPPASAGPNAPELAGSPAWTLATVELVPCLRPLQVSHPVDEYLTAVRRGERPEVPAPAEHFLAVSRREFQVTMTRLEAEEHTLLAALAAGVEIGAATATLGLMRAETWRWLEVWAGRGWLVAINTRSKRGTT